VAANSESVSANSIVKNPYQAKPDDVWLVQEGLLKTGKQ